MTPVSNKNMAGRKAQFLNLSEDGLRIRATTFKNKATYSRKTKHKSQGDW